MKQMWIFLLAFFLGAGFVFLGIFLFRQSESGITDPVITAYLTQQLPDSLMVCSLTDEALLDRKQELRQRIVPLIRQKIEHAHGYSFEFDAQEGLATALLGFIEAERTCCPFFHFDLSFFAFEGKIVLRISGPPGVKRWIDFLEES